MVPEHERGYALVAAVTAVAACAYVAFEVLATDQGTVASLGARAEQARLMAAADAGLNLAIHALGDSNRARRWSGDGRTRRIAFGETALSIVVEDERAKAPLNALDDHQARALFQGAGATGDRLDALVGEYREWVTEDNAVHNPPLPPAQRPVRHGPFATVAELSGLKDMDAALLARIAPAVTVFSEGNGVFETRLATPLAIATVDAEDNETPETLDNETQIAQQRPAEEIAPDDHLIGHPMTIRVVAQARDGARAHRTAVVELTGDPARPYYVRYTE